MTADDLIRLLGLVEHPTCGFVRESYRSLVRLPSSALPQDYRASERDGASGTAGAPSAPRTLGDAMYFLVTPGAHMRLHRIRADQLYHHYLGDPLEVLMLGEQGGFEIVTVGSDLAAGMRPQLLIPGGTVHVSRVRPGGAYALLATTVYISVEPEDVDIVDPAATAARDPSIADALRTFGLL